MGPRRVLRATASQPDDVPELSKRIVECLDSLFLHLDEQQKMDELNQRPPPEAEEPPMLSTFWEKAARFVGKEKAAKHIDDSAHLLSVVMGNSVDEAAAWIMEKLSPKTIPDAPGQIFTSTIYHWMYDEAGHWRGEPSNAEVRKIARGIATSNFHQDQHIS